MGTEQNVQEIQESNKLQGDLTAENALALANGGSLTEADIAAEQRAEEERIRAEIAAKKGGGTAARVESSEVASAAKEESPAQAQDYFGEAADTGRIPDESGAVDLMKKGKFVPVEEHAKLRKRAQAAEQRIAELEQTLTAGATAGQLDADVQLEDGVPVEGKVVKQLLARQERAILGRVGEVLEQRDRQLAASIAESQTKNRLIHSQTEARKKFADYDAVIGAAIQNGILLSSEVEAAKREANPGATLYLFARRNLAALGIQPKPLPGQSSRENPAKSEQENQAVENEQILSPEALFDGTLSGKFSAKKKTEG